MPPKTYPYVTLAVLTALNTLNYIDRNMLLGVQPLVQREFGITDEQAGALTTAFFRCYMVALPLVGWGMLSAGHYPIVMFGPVHLPAILPANPTLYAVLRKTHTILAYFLFVTFLIHLSTVLFHTLVIRDKLLNRMALWPTGTSKANPDVSTKSNNPEATNA